MSDRDCEHGHVLRRKCSECSREDDEAELVGLRVRVAELEAKLSAMHRRAQKAEAALPEWHEIVALHKDQRTGKFGPALAASAVVMADEKIAALQDENARLRRYRERTRGCVDNHCRDEAHTDCFSVIAEDIAREEGVE